MRAGMERKYIGLGMVFGLIFGAATDHIGLGFALGFVIGSVVAAAKARRGQTPR